MPAYHLFEIAVIAVAVAGSLLFVCRRWLRRLIAGARGKPMARAAAGGCASCNDCGSCAPKAKEPVERPMAFVRRP